MIDRLKSDLTLPFFGIFGFMLLYTALPGLVGHNLPVGAEILGSFISYFSISWWLMDDARRMRFTLPMSYGMMMLFFSPFFAPIYLFQTRGLMAFVSMALYAFTFICIVAINFLIYIR